jgi:replicative DNA helicase
MTNGQTTTDEAPIEATAWSLLRAVYHNPEHIRLLASIDPPMPTNATHAAKTALLDAEDDGALDTAHVARQAGRDIARRLSRVDDMGATMELTRLADDPEQIERWAVLLREAAAKGSLRKDLRDLVRDMPGRDVSLDAITQHIVDLANRASADSGQTSLAHIATAVEAAHDRLDEYEAGRATDFIRTGIASFDDRFGGFPRQNQSILSGLSGSGKTTLVLHILRSVAKAERRRRERNDTSDPIAAAMFSIEMPSEVLAMRLAIAEYNDRRPDGTRYLTAALLRDGGATDAERASFRRTLDFIRDLSIYVDPDPSPTPQQIRSRCLRLRAKYDLGFVAIDYDELVDASGAGEERVAAISRSNTRTAKEANCAVLSLSQLKSAAEDRNGAPRDTDLRYSRKKQHDAHTVVHWYWPQYWVRKGREPNQDYIADHPNRGYLLVSKNRGGRTGRIPLDFYAEELRFADPSTGDDGPDAAPF